MNDTVLVTGASGLLGRAIVRSLPTTNEIIGCHSRLFDIRDRAATIDAITRHKPHIIIHCAAIGSVDKVQADIKSGCAVNLQGTQNVIDAASIVGSRLVFVSTNAVFDGRSPPYSEESLLCPISNYGIIKAAAEFSVKASGLNWMIIRPILMYGNNHAGRNNWVTTWINLLRDGKECLVVDDVVSQPLYNYDCADVVIKAMKAGMWGEIFNVGGGDRCTLYEFAQLVADSYGYDRKLIKPVPSSYFPNIAPRPRDCSYDLSKIKDNLQHTPCKIIDGLIAMRKERPANG